MFGPKDEDLFEWSPYEAIVFRATTPPIPHEVKGHHSPTVRKSELKKEYRGVIDPIMGRSKIKDQEKRLSAIKNIPDEIAIYIGVLNPEEVHHAQPIMLDDGSVSKHTPKYDLDYETLFEILCARKFDPLSTVRRNRNAIRREIERVYNSFISGKTYSSGQALIDRVKKIAEKWTQKVRDYITGSEKPKGLSNKTLDEFRPKKAILNPSLYSAGDETPLVESGQLLEHIGWQIDSRQSSGMKSFISSYGESIAKQRRSYAKQQEEAKREQAVERREKTKIKSKVDRLNAKIRSVVGTSRRVREEDTEEIIAEREKQFDRLVELKNEQSKISAELESKNIAHSKKIITDFLDKQNELRSMLHVFRKYKVRKLTESEIDRLNLDRVTDKELDRALTIFAQTQGMQRAYETAKNNLIGISKNSLIEESMTRMVDEFLKTHGIPITR